MLDPAASLAPQRLGALARRAVAEWTQCGAVFDLPSAWWHEPPTDLDLSVEAAGRRVDTPFGVGSGPHGTLAPNLVLAWLAGARYVELPAARAEPRGIGRVHHLDVATIGLGAPGPPAIGLDQHVEECVKANMLLGILAAAGAVSSSAAAARLCLVPSLDGDLASIRQGCLGEYLAALRAPTATVDRLRDELIGPLRRFGELDFATPACDAVALSVSNGGSLDELVGIARYLLEEQGLDLVVRLDPSLLGQGELEDLLGQRLGFAELAARAVSLDAALSVAQVVEALETLQSVARASGRTVAVHCSGPLRFASRELDPDQPTLLFGRPLFPLTLRLARLLRPQLSAALPMGLGGGIDLGNAAAAVSAGFAPVLSRTDLLRPGGYGRLGRYLVSLEEGMLACGASDIPGYVQSSHRAAESSTSDAVDGTLERLAERALGQDRYTCAHLSARPRKIGSRLELLDCISCDKCVSVCPNDAVFGYATPVVAGLCEQAVVAADGTVRVVPDEPFRIERPRQYATWVGSCDECGNCDVFCPEDGGPHLAKARLFTDRALWQRHEARHGVLLAMDGDRVTVDARMDGRAYRLELDRRTGIAQLSDQQLALVIDAESGAVRSAERVPGTMPAAGHRLSVRPARALLAMVAGILETGHPNPLTAELK